MNHHCSRWVQDLWWHPHARGVRYCKPIKGILWQDCCRREDQLWLAPDQYFKSYYTLVQRLQEYQSHTITNWHHQRFRISHCNWSFKTEGQDQEAQPRRIVQPKQGRWSRQAKTAQGLDHMVRGSQELPINHSCSVQSFSQLCDQGSCGTRLYHIVSNRLQLRSLLD